jgi:hypothetical protein
MSAKYAITSEAQRKECAALLHAIRNTSQMFYSRAQLIGVHTFIEFTGLINEYINLCQWAMEHDIDFRHINVHSCVEMNLPTHDVQIQYIGKKFACIFSPWLQKKEFRDLFMSELHVVDE